MIHPGAEAESSCPTVEGYAAENLTSPDELVRQKGFLPDNFISPPVSVDVRLPFPIHLSHVSFGSRVGSRKSEFFEVHVRGAANGQWTRVGRGNSVPGAGTNDECVLFKNYLFPGNRHRADVCKGSSEFRMSPSDALEDVSHVRIRIVRTAKSSAPCLKKLQVFGSIARSVSEIERSTFFKKLSAITAELDRPTPEEKDQAAAVVAAGPDLEDFLEDGGSRLRGAEKVDGTSDQVPDEFLDALTFELMDVPMVLPSGQVVDKTTLEKHAESEARFGRPPSDPFTGKTFRGKQLGPVFNAALKCRIDEYVLKRNGIDAHQIRTKRPRDHPDNCDGSLQTLVPNKRLCSGTGKFSLSENVVETALPAQPNTFSTTKASSGKAAESSSLDDLLKKVLAGTTPIITGSRSQKVQSESKCCMCLEAEYDSDRNDFYQILVCRHLLCRGCLIALPFSEVDKLVKCRVCSSAFQRLQVVKYLKKV